MTPPHEQPRPHLFTIKDSPRLTRALWDRFRQAASERGENTIDALRRALELYLAQEKPHEPPEPR